MTLVHKLQREKKKKKDFILIFNFFFNSALAKLLLVSVIIIGNKAAPPKHDFQSQSRLSVQKYIQHIFLSSAAAVSILHSWPVSFFSVSFLVPAIVSLFFSLLSSVTPAMTATYEMLKKTL